jgi:hypothetical protein
VNFKIQGELWSELSHHLRVGMCVCVALGVRIVTWMLTWSPLTERSGAYSSVWSFLLILIAIE